MAEYNFYRIIVHLKEGKMKQGVRRYAGERREAMGNIITLANNAFGINNILRIEIKDLPDSDISVQLYKLKWM